MRYTKKQVKNFSISINKTDLHGRVDVVSKEKPVVIFIPGVSGNALTNKFDWLSKTFTGAGFNFVRFNFSGYEGDKNFEESSLNDELEDFKNLLGKLIEMGFNMKKYGVVAKSIGAIKAISVRDPRLKCLGLLGPAISLDRTDNLSKTANILYKNIELYSEYKLSFSMVKNVSASVVFYGDKDLVVNKVDTKNLFIHLSNPKELYCLPNEDHSLKKANTKLFIKAKIAKFFQMYL